MSMNHFALLSSFVRLKHIFSRQKQQSPVVDTNSLASVPNPPHPFLQGNESFWVDEIWYPYWESLTEGEKRDIKAKTPTDAWREWIDLRSKWVREARIGCERKGLHFDYRTYVEDFRVSYRMNYLQEKK